LAPADNFSIAAGYENRPPELASQMVTTMESPTSISGSAEGRWS
jgi:hypothetical protein